MENKIIITYEKLKDNQVSVSLEAQSTEYCIDILNVLYKTTDSLKTAIVKRIEKDAADRNPPYERITLTMSQLMKN